MVALLGLDDSAVAEACRIGAEVGIVEAVNFNGPGQVVIAGERAAVERAVEAAKRLGAKRAVTLPVSVPSHSSLMREAAHRLAAQLRSTAFAAPRITYVSAVDAQPHIDPADIRNVLERQVASPVRWQDTVRALVARNVGLLLECGPGKVLTGLNRRIERRPGLQCLAIEDEASIEAALAACESRPAADAASPHS